MMMAPQIIDRKQLKREIREQLNYAKVSPKAMTALYLGIVLALNLLDYFTGGVSQSILTTFVSILVRLMGMLLSVGFTLYCMAIRRGEQTGYLTLFDGFSFVGKILGLQIVMYFFILLWSMLFLIPGIIAAYRYRFAILNLCENPGIGIMEALDMSKRQTVYYKLQLFLLDLSYLGWTLLASLLMVFQSVYLSYHLALSDLYTTDPFAALEQLPALPFLPDWGWILLSGIWLLVITMFYLPHYQCTELEYFEIAKQTTGSPDFPSNF